MGDLAGVTQSPRPPRRPRHRRGVAHPVLHVTAGGRRLRRRRLPRRRPAVRHPRRLRRPGRRRPPARRAGHRRPGAQPHLRPAPVVPGGAGRPSPGSAARRRYVFRDGRGPHGDEPPNNWRSVFGGSAWTRTTTPDGRPASGTSTCSTPAARPELDQRRRARRVRVDPAVLARPRRRRVPHRRRPRPGQGPGVRRPHRSRTSARHGVRLGHPHWDRDEVHDVYRSWRRIVDGYRSSAIFVGEVWVHDARADRSLPAARRAAHGVQLRVPARPVGRAGDAYGDRRIDRRVRRRRRAGDVGARRTTTSRGRSPATAAASWGGAGPVRRALLMLALPGGAYVYQGEELGLPEVLDLPDEVRQDPAFWRTGGEDGRPRRVSGPDPVVGRRAVLRLRPRRGELAAATARVGVDDRRARGGRSRLDTVAVPVGAAHPS